MGLDESKMGATPLKDSDIKEGKVLSLAMRPELKYAWDDGVAIGRYLKELKAGKIIARKCNKCSRIMIPPRMFCELCWCPTDEWVYCKDTGTVNTFSICNVNWDASRIPEGQPRHLPAVIHIDGASYHMGILHRLGDVDPKDIKIGMRVKAVWKKPEDREGAITDIMHWKPMDPSESGSDNNSGGGR